MPNASLFRSIALSPCLGTVLAASGHEDDERAIRNVVDQAISRLNRGDVTAFEDFWDEHADYAVVDGRLTKGRMQIQALFREMTRSGAGQQTVMIEQIRFITPELATVDGSWIVAGLGMPQARNYLRSRAEASIWLRREPDSGASS